MSRTVLASVVTLPPERVCNGFSQTAYLTLFDTRKSCVCLCFLRFGRHSHMFASCDSDEMLADVTEAAMSDPSGIAEDLLADIYDEASDTERAAMEVNSARSYD